MKQLDRLLFEQGGDCFFCKKPLVKADASVEHLQAQANGGTSAEENVVVCCKAINALLGSKPLKDKFAIVLRQKHGFQCPARAAVTEPSIPHVTDGPAVFQSIPKLAKARQATKEEVLPKRSATLRPPISSAGIVALTKFPAVAKPPPVSASSRLCPTCRGAVPTALGQVDYVCPHCRGAFRY